MDPEELPPDADTPEANVVAAAGAATFPAADDSTTATISPSIPQGCHFPLLIEDSTLDAVPEHLTKLLEWTAGHPPFTRMDILIATLYALSLENGFLLSESKWPEGCAILWSSTFSASFVSQCPVIVPREYRNLNSDSFEIPLTLFGLSSRKCLLFARDVSGGICVTFVFENMPAPCVYLPVSEYTLTSSLRRPTKCVKNLKELTKKMREHLFVPARNAILDAEQQPYLGILGVPSEIQLMILKLLDLKALQCLSHTCTGMRHVIGHWRTKNESK